MSLLDEPKEQQTVIDINQLNSDIEADIDELSGRDDEIDLLNEKDISSTHNPANDANSPIYKRRYRDLVHAIRQLSSNLEIERQRHENQEKILRKQLAAFKDGTDNQNHDGVSLINVASDGEIASKQNSHRQSSKLKDLEKLMAKCKESLKAKNQQLKILRDSLVEVDKFKAQMDDVKDELKELRQAHETWTLSIAENKRVMHHEIENKNLEIEKLKAEIKDSNNRSMQLKSNIQTLESRLVSTSAAHQKERESLSKELVAAKNNAIRQLQKDHDLLLERVKLDFERAIENLKLELLVKDEQIIRNAEREHELQEHNCSLKTDLENTKRKLDDTVREILELRSIREAKEREVEELKRQIDEITISKEDDLALRDIKKSLEEKNVKLSEELQELRSNLSLSEESNSKLKQELMQHEQVASEQKKECIQCLDLRTQLTQDAEKHKQSCFELNAKLELMTTAICDQEKVLQDLKSEREKSIETIRSLKTELDELAKKNETMSQVIQETEAELHSQQEQLKEFDSTKFQLENMKKENGSLISSLEQVKAEMSEKIDDLNQSQLALDDLKKRLVAVEEETRNISQSSMALKQEKDSLVIDLAAESKRRKDLEQQLVVSILAAIKNLDTPDTSPGSDKTYKSDVPDPADSNHEVNLPDPIRLAEELSSLALDKSNAYVTSNQRLQAVLLDNSMINEELARLKEELHALNNEKKNEVLTSLEEVERLRTENQALIHDQKAYDDLIASLEQENSHFKIKISESLVKETSTCDAATVTESCCAPTLASGKDDVETCHDSEDIPDPTEFKYLKNIVYQFMMGKEPTTLARVISAVFKFDPGQVEQICRVQEAIHQMTGK